MFQISTENIQSLNRESLKYNLTTSSVHILKIPTENSDKPFEVFTMKSSRKTKRSKNVINNSCNDNPSFDNDYKRNFNNKTNNTNESDDDNDFLINIKYSNRNENYNSVDVRERSVINKNKKNYKKKNRKIHSNELNNFKRSKPMTVNNSDIALHNQRDNLDNDKLIHNVNDQRTNSQILKLGDEDSGNTSDNDVFFDNNIFIKDNEHIHKDIQDEFVINNSNDTKKSIIKKGVKKPRNARKKPEEINVKAEHLNITVTEIGAVLDNSESIMNKRNTKEFSSKSILPEFMSLFAKPKNDNFFSKDNMDNFSKGT